jgi:iron complex outermembrane receptor protein
VTTNGLDAAVTVPVGYGFTLYNGLTWNRSTYDDNVNTYSGTTEVTLPYKGKIAVDTPEFMWKTQLGYHNKGFFSTLDADYMSTRYYSYDNTGSVDGRFLSNFGAGYNRGELGPLQDLKLQLSIYNLFGERYYSSIGTNGFVGSDTTGTADTLQVGSPRAFGGSLSVRF